MKTANQVAQLPSLFPTPWYQWEGRLGARARRELQTAASNCIFSPVQESMTAEEEELSVCVTSLTAVEGGRKEKDLVINFFTLEARKADCSSGNDGRNYFKKPLGSHDARSQTRK